MEPNDRTAVIRGYLWRSIRHDDKSLYHEWLQRILNDEEINPEEGIDYYDKPFEEHVDIEKFVRRLIYNGAAGESFWSKLKARGINGPWTENALRIKEIADKQMSARKILCGSELEVARVPYELINIVKGYMISRKEIVDQCYALEAVKK